MLDSASFGNGGWVRVFEAGAEKDADDGRRFVLVRFVEDSAGVFEIGEVYFHGKATPNAVAKLPIKELLGWANSPTVSAILREQLHFIGPDLYRAATYYSTTTYRDDWVADSYRARRPNAERECASCGARSKIKQAPLVTKDHTVQRYRRQVDARLDVPPGRRPDSFYAEVAALYRELVGAGMNPGSEMAKANNVSPSTAHTWIRIARRRGILEQAEKQGKAG